MFSINNYLTDVRNFGYQIRNTGLRMIIFKERKYPIVLNKIKELYYICYLKSINCIYDQMFYYNSLSDDDKLLLDTITALLY